MRTHPSLGPVVKRVAVGSLFLGAAACTGTPPVTPPIDTSDLKISTAQADALSDEKVTYEEYREGFKRYSECIEAGGYSLIGVEEVNQIFSYAVLDIAVFDGVESDCYVREFEYLDIYWQVANQDSSETADVIRECLSSNGHDPKIALDDMLTQLEEAGLTDQDCY